MNAFVVGIIAGDVLLAVFAISAAFLIKLGTLPFFISNGSYGMRILIFVIVLVFSSFLSEVYDPEKTPKGTDLVSRIMLSMLLALLIFTCFYYILPLVTFGTGILIPAVIGFGLFQWFWHGILRVWAKYPAFAKKVLILGTGPLARQIGSIIASTNKNYILSGYLNCASDPVTVPQYRIVGDDSHLLATARKEKAHKIVVSLTEKRGALPLEEMLTCKLSGIKVMDAQSFYEKVTGKLMIEHISPSWFIFSHGFRINWMFRTIKRVLDVIISSILIIIASPLFILTPLLIKMDSNGPIFFKQTRVGEKDSLFTLYKFRTMRQDAEKETGAVWATKNDSRVTRVGKFLRKTRIDELPQLFNVLIGDMSLVGPRPERPEFVSELKQIIPYFSERHYIKPGVTGWAQVSYPYGASVSDALEKLRYDMYYIKNWSFALDIFIVLETVKVVLFGRGAR
jgi:sugar transferase (PEP-CTERM system associated)